MPGGPDGHRRFGAGEGMARLAAQGSACRALVSLGIALVLATSAACALAGAGVLARPPFLRTVLVAVTAIYLVRGIAGFLLAAFAPGGNSPAFWLWSSTICLAIGAVHAAGVWLAWPLSAAPRS